MLFVMAARNPFEAPHVESRRGGPAKEPLSRDAIVTEALRQLTVSGRKGMSLRKVATALETGPASLYAYVDDLQELQALVLDRALGSVDTRGAKRGAWRANLESLLASYLEVLFASPGLAQLALSAIAVGPSALRITERQPGPPTCSCSTPRRSPRSSAARRRSTTRPIPREPSRAPFVGSRRASTPTFTRRAKSFFQAVGGNAWPG